MPGDSQLHLRKQQGQGQEERQQQQQQPITLSSPASSEGDCSGSPDASSTPPAQVARTAARAHRSGQAGRRHAACRRGGGRGNPSSHSDLQVTARRQGRAGAGGRAEPGSCTSSGLWATGSAVHASDVRQTVCRRGRRFVATHSLADLPTCRLRCHLWTPFRTRSSRTAVSARSTLGRLYTRKETSQTTRCSC